MLQITTLNHYQYMLDQIQVYHHLTEQQSFGQHRSYKLVQDAY